MTRTTTNDVIKANDGIKIVTITTVLVVGETNETAKRSVRKKRTRNERKSMRRRRKRKRRIEKGVVALRMMMTMKVSQIITTAKILKKHLLHHRDFPIE